MKIFQLLTVPLVSFLFVPIANAKAPSPAHNQLSSDLENATNWSKHLQEEANKGTKLSRVHVDQEIKGLQDAFKSIESSTAALGNESPTDLRGGHFLALRDHQKKAASFVDHFVSEYSNSTPNYSRMKSDAKKTLRELEAATFEHKKELNEMEQ